MPEPENLTRLRERATARTYDWVQGRDLTAVADILAQFWKELEEMRTSLRGAPADPKQVEEPRAT